MAKLIYLLPLLLFSQNLFSALEYSKIEHPGCPENAFCQKNTGEVRQAWLDTLDNFNKKKITESKLNADLQKEYGVPLSGWAMEEAGVLPRIMMWDSPCKQHKKDATKFYISDLFRKNLKDSELKDFTNIYFPKAILLDADKKPYSMTIPRGDLPTFMENGALYFLKDDDGKYYGLMVDKSGDIKVTTPQSVKETSKEVVCLKEQADLFLRLSPSPTFYQGYLCREVWDKTSKTYKTILFGWSCN
ncbi:MAG: hypothetical protein K2Q18_13775 [Bdellovibrionales bacterium]|nr:hypothetical protein [Bdellovibrionales bacterium]